MAVNVSSFTKREGKRSGTLKGDLVPHTSRENESQVSASKAKKNFIVYDELLSF